MSISNHVIRKLSNHSGQRIHHLQFGVYHRRVVVVVIALVVLPLAETGTGTTETETGTEIASLVEDTMTGTIAMTETETDVADPNRLAGGAQETTGTETEIVPGLPRQTVTSKKMMTGHVHHLLGIDRLTPLTSLSHFWLLVFLDDLLQRQSQDWPL